jgi:hypothetical protein
MIEWIRSYQALFAWLAVASTVIFVVSVVLVPFFIIRLPSDYFAPGKDQERLRAGRHFVLKSAVMIGRNILGCVLLVAGLLMLVLPGQGLLTILVAAMLLDFPGKKRFERWIVSRGPVLQAINWIRRRAGRPPLTPGVGE